MNHSLVWLLLSLTAALAAQPGAAIGLDFGVARASGRSFDGVGGLSGGGATSTFLLAYKEPQRSQILDWMFKPDHGAGLNILKVEVGSDDQTTDGCEGCHMRSATEVDCHRGYEWGLMKAATARNPSIILYGLPWAWAGWLGFGTNSPYANVTATADYTAKWIECGRDAHGLNITMIGLWNEEPGPTNYILALRQRLDAGGLHHVRIIAPDQGGSGMDNVAHEMAASPALKAAVWGLGSHYPGASGTSDFLRGTNISLWSAEDYSTYSDATGAGCWGRLLVQNLGWDLTATISWYLIGSFARGMDYDSDGLLRAEWPTSGHFEITPMMWTTMHWTRFVKPGWRAVPCTDVTALTGRCALPGGGNYAALTSPDTDDIAIIVHTFTHDSSKCVRNDPPDWEIDASQTVSFKLAGVKPADVHVWRSCTGWVYPGDTDGWFERQPDAAVTADGTLTVQIARDCYYTFTTVGGVTKPPVPAGVPGSVAFPLPYADDFDGVQVGAEAPFFGDQMGKWETVAAGGGRTGNVSRQQLGQPFWPICNRGHSQPISIIGDMFFRDVAVSADVLVEEAGVGAGLALRTRNGFFFRGVTPGLYLYVLASPGISTKPNPNDPGAGEPGGIPAVPDVPIGNVWKLCTNSFCAGTPIASGQLPSVWKPGEWHRLSLQAVGENATAAMDGRTFYAGGMTAPSTDAARVLPTRTNAVAAGIGDPGRSLQNRSGLPTTGTCQSTMEVLPPGQMLVGADYRQTQLQSDPSDNLHCIQACCKDARCEAWAVAVSEMPTSPTCTHGTVCCFLKNKVSAVSKGTGELAAGRKPGNHPPGPPPPSPDHPYGGVVPATGWAALVTTLGNVQYDDFKLEGKAKGGGAVDACGAATPTAGSPVVAAPCDAPGLQHTWARSKTGALELVGGNDAVGSLCLGAVGHSKGNLAVLVPCGDSSAVQLHDRSTGMIMSPPTTTPAEASSPGVAAGPPPPHPEGSACLDVAGATASGPPWPQATTGNSCGQPSLANSQQYQFNPATGALRPKASVCTASFLGTVNQYRDCCLSVCPP